MLALYAKGRSTGMMVCSGCGGVLCMHCEFVRSG